MAEARKKVRRPQLSAYPPKDNRVERLLCLTRKALAVRIAAALASCCRSGLWLGRDRIFPSSPISSVGPNARDNLRFGWRGPCFARAVTPK